MTAMLRRTYDDQVCSVAWTLELVGDRWTFLIVRDALLGTTTFSAFRRQLNIAANVLANRLDRLVTAGVLQRTPYQRAPLRYEYQLTPKGQALELVVLAMMQWGDTYLAGETGPPRVAFHRECHGAVHAQLRCRSCADEVSADEIVTRPTDGPA